MGIVISLLNESEFLSLRLIQPRLDTVSFFESLETKDEQLCIVLVI